MPAGRSLERGFRPDDRPRADESQADTPVIYASAWRRYRYARPGMSRAATPCPLFYAILKYIPALKGDLDAPLLRC